MNSSNTNTPAPGDASSSDTAIVAPDKAANDAAVDASTDPKVDNNSGDKINDSGDKINASPSVIKFRINDKRGTKR
jgi:hypothetical protein